MKAFLTLLTIIVQYGVVSQAPYDRPQQQYPTINPAQISAFLEQYPKFSGYKNNLLQLYSKHPTYFWFEAKKLSEIGEVLKNDMDNINREGVFQPVPYHAQLANLFVSQQPSAQHELFLSSIYLFYYETVFCGLPVSGSEAMGWYLPREKRDISSWIDSALTDDHLSKPSLFYQYYLLRKSLARYQEIVSSGGWQQIEYNSETLCPGDSAPIIRAIRSRLFKEKLLKKDSESFLYDDNLQDAIASYCRIAGLDDPESIDRTLLESLNIPANKRLETIAVNMERCRWVPLSFSSINRYIAINIPSFSLVYYDQGSPVLTSKVIVGKQVSQTIVFSGEISSIVLAPYWNVPKSITNNEILPIAQKDPSYLSRNHFEWANGNLRQKPGPYNALGSVKFVFPNSNNIYLHDTPLPALFSKRRRSYSHGCIRVEKAKELAKLILLQDGGFSADEVEKDMTKSKPTVHHLKVCIPIYIAYFTAWADENGNIRFFEDIYAKDSKLSGMLFSN